jgi:TolB protein
LPPAEAPLEALIREARRRARRRRCLYAGTVALLALLGVLGATVLGDPAESGTVAAGSASGSSLSAGSPSRLAFISSGDRSFGSRSVISVVNADGSGKRILTRIADPGGLAWSPDGRKLAFVALAPAGLAEIYVINADGSGLRRVTHSPMDQTSIGPAWSPDGRMIAFGRSSFQHLGPGQNIFVVNADGSGQRKVTRKPLPVAGHAWTPDGRKLAIATWNRGGPGGTPGRPTVRFGDFLVDLDARFDVFLVNLDGSGQRNLTREWKLDGMPVWSRDGRRIAFVSGCVAKCELSVMDADGTGLQRLSRVGAVDVGTFVLPLPSWSPDGQQIAFAAMRGGQSEIHVVNADGSRERRLVAHGTLPVWSPDGRTIAFSNDNDLFAVNVDGSGQRQLTHTAWYDLAPAWSPLGSR